MIDLIRVHQTNVDLADVFELERERGAKYRAALEKAKADRDRAMTDLVAELVAWRSQ